ncbi:MAG: hypothetical protein WC565_08565 [Parcubacteria group bacterium]
MDLDPVKLEQIKKAQEELAAFYREHGLVNFADAIESFWTHCENRQGGSE